MDRPDTQSTGENISLAETVPPLEPHAPGSEPQGPTAEEGVVAPDREQGSRPSDAEADGSRDGGEPFVPAEARPDEFPPQDESQSQPADAEHPEPEQQSVETQLADIAATLGSLDTRLGESQRLLGRQSEFADKLHAENQRLREGELRAATLPLIRDLLRLHDDIGKLSVGREDTRDLDIVKVSLLDALARNGVLAFEPAVGDVFDPKQHNIQGVVATGESSLDRTIAVVTRVGVQWDDGQTIRVADVSVYKHTPRADADDLSGPLVAEQPMEKA